MFYRRGAGIVLLRNLWDYTGNYCTLPIFFFLTSYILHLTPYTLHSTPYTLHHTPDLTLAAWSPKSRGMSV
jgi:hypothetical protein